MLNLLHPVAQLLVHSTIYPTCPPTPALAALMSKRQEVQLGPQRQLLRPRAIWLEGTSEARHVNSTARPGGELFGQLRPEHGGFETVNSRQEHGGVFGGKQRVQHRTDILLYIILYIYILINSDRT